MSDMDSASEKDDAEQLSSTYDPGEGPSKKRKLRNRKPVTCAQCRKRKLRCDRQNPCSACKERGEGDLCEWEGAIRLPPSNYTRDQEAEELRKQLDRLEGLLSVLAQTTDDGNVQVDSTLQAGIGSSLGEFRKQIATHREEKAVVRTLSIFASDRNLPQPALIASSISRLDQEDLTGSTANDFLKLLPPPTELQTSAEIFFRRNAGALPIIHPTVFQQRLDNVLRGSVDDSDTFFIAFLLAIMAAQSRRLSQVHTGSSSFGSSFRSVSKTHVDAAIQVLNRGGFMTVPSLDSVRALLVLYDIYSDPLPDAAAPFMLNAALQVALSLGLNRDPRSQGGVDIIEAEDRRRIWTILVSHDWINNFGRTYMCSPIHYDTLLPANARDEDIARGGVIAQPPNTFTPVLEILFKAQIATAARNITDRAFGIRVVPSWNVILELNSELEQVEGSLSPYFKFEWTGGAVRPFGTDVSEVDLSKVRIHLLLRQQIIRLHRPFLTRGFVDPRFKFGREKCCWAARYILAVHRGLGFHPRAIDLAPLIFHTLNAMLVLAIDLLQDPNGENAENQRADLNSSLYIFENIAGKPPAMQEVFRIISILQDAKVRPGSGLRVHSSLEALDPSASFRTLLPVSMSSEIRVPRQVSPDRSGWVNLWQDLAKYRCFYAVPDGREWEELSRVDSRPWVEGIDVLY